MDRYVRLMAAAKGTGDVVDAVALYLAGWTRERILNLQKTDAGWAPFDDRQQPVPVCAPADILRICHSVRSQCIALKDSGIVPAHELLELDLFLFLARQIIEDRDPACTRTYANALHSSKGRRPRPFESQFIGSPF